ncbi:hypothetical protein BFG04_05175 [Campylobacter pinnipediorum subsp. pinnipediorum]|uniref:Ornithine cyclodeaminase n=1 Tax=Campylobacter pinnipediorum subsp. pinnipediorum TaxID=1660067 RepID=A0AAX0L8W0_9BACT|nr:hypothetical protein [Campylobacter pinnipediorum]OPA75840.1 hypothetical protein BFG04_05175 [Campylobacter pinnipediorum subsp. pinnipediorum]
MIYISDNDVKNIIQDNIDLVVEVMKECFITISNKDYSLSGRLGASHGARISYKKQDKERMFIAMPGYLGGSFNITGMKWHGPMLKLVDSNKESNYLLVLNDSYSGIPLAIMDANLITQYRTAAVSLLAAMFLAQKEAKSLAIIGPGVINTLITTGILNHFKGIKDIFVKGRGKKSIDVFVKNIQDKYKDVKIHIVSKVEDAVKDADIVSINTLLSFDKISDMPFVKKDWMKPKSLFLCSAFAHFPDSVLVNGSNKVCDLFAMYESYENELGFPAYKYAGFIGNKFADLYLEGKIKKSDIFDIGEIITKKNHTKDNDLPTIFSSSGLSLEDLALGFNVYQKAKELKIGHKIF